MNGFLIAGTNSGSGKTTITIGLMALLKDLGYNVAGFKSGPDYIDPMFHKFVLQRPSYNLDTWMNEDDTVRYLFQSHAKDQEIAIVEGVMGMYDGYDAKNFKGSGYHVAKTLNLPVILVIDGSSMASSVAAIANGFKHLMPDSHVKGVILNNVASEMHYHHLSQAMLLHSDIPCVGYVKRNPEISIDSRHLGLIQASEIEDLKEKIEKLKDTLKETMDVELLLKLTKMSFERSPYTEKTYLAHRSSIEEKIRTLKLKYGGRRIGIAKDKAFTFYYEDNIDLLEKIGIELVPFSPLEDASLPKDVDRYYIGGGYPEVYAKSLEQNKPFRAALQKALKEGRPALAECGGLMYLMEGIKPLDQDAYDMVGLFKGQAEMTGRLHHFGYVHSAFSKGKVVRAHEFHKSQVHLEDEAAVYGFEVTKKQKKWPCGLTKARTVATYSHVHFYSNFDYLEWFLNL